MDESSEVFGSGEGLRDGSEGKEGESADDEAEKNEKDREGEECDMVREDGRVCVGS